MQKHKSISRVIAVVLALMLVVSLCTVAAVAEVERTENSLTIASTTKTALAPGVTETSVVSYDKNGKRVQYFVVDCDVSNGTTQVKANYHDNDNTGVWGKATVVEQANAAKTKRGYNVVATTNAAYYNVTTGQPTGAFVMEGVNINGDSMGNSYEFFAQMDDGTYMIGEKNEFSTVSEHVVEAVGGHLMLVRDGAVVEGLNSTDKYPRSTVGLKADGSVVLMLADGNNQPYSIGLTYAEQAQLMLELGCVDAIELDGGGSATYAAKPEGSDEIEVRNVCCDGTVRSVSNTLMVISTATADGTFDHANLSTDYAFYTPGSNVQINAVGADAAGGAADIPSEGVTWSLTEPVPEATAPVADNYYLVGSFNDWEASGAYQLTANPRNEGEFYINHTFAVGDEFKVIKYVDGTNDIWYPGGDNWVIDESNAGTRTLFFRPDGQGNDDWIDKTIYIAYRNIGTIQNGVFRTAALGTVTANMLYNDTVVGSVEITVVHPTSIAFSAAEKTVPYGKSADFSITAMYNGAEVFAPASAYEFGMTAGRMEGFMYYSPDDETIASATVTATYKYDETLEPINVAVTFGKGSEVLFDFEDGDVSDWLDWRGMEEAIANGEYPADGYTMPYVGNNTAASNSVDIGIQEGTFLATRDNGGKVHSGNYALGYTFDYTNAASFGNWMYGYLYYKGDTKVFRDTANGVTGTRLGMWMYIPEEAVGSCSRLSYTYKASNGTLSVAYLYFTYQYVKKGFSKLTSDKIPESGWAYVYCDLDDISNTYVTTSYYKDGEGNLVRAAASNYAPAFIQWIVSSSAKGAENVTFYIDDITLDYSDVVDDRDLPIISNPKALDDLNAYTLDGSTVSTNVLSFTADAVEDTIHNPGNATGIDASTAKVYIDGNEVACKFSAGKINTGYFTLPNGIHDISFEIADKQGNVAKMTRQVTVASDATYPVISLVGQKLGQDKVKTGGQYNLLVNTDQAEKISKVTTTIWLNSASKWALEHATPADGFSYTYTIDEIACKATITITNDGSALAGEQTLLSIPVYAWSWNEDLDNVSAHDQWTGTGNGGGCSPVVTISYKTFLGEVEYVDGTVDTPANYVAGFGNIRQDVETELDTAIGNLKNTIGEWHYHTEVAVDDKAATCTEEGYTGRTKCSDPDCNSIINWGTVTPTTGHAYQYINGEFVCADCGDVLEIGTGLIEADGTTYYAVAGNLMPGWQMVDNDWYYFDENTFAGVDGVVAASAVGVDGDFTYTFDKGRLTDGEWVTDANGTRYYYGPGFYHGRSSVNNIIEIDGNTYAFDDDGYRLTGIAPVVTSQWTTAIAWIFTDEGVYTGQTFTGVLGDYYYGENGLQITTPYYGLVEYDGDFYYISDKAKIVRNKNQYLTTTNDLTFADGTVIPHAYYQFDADGKMIVPEGIVGDNYYHNGVMAPAYTGLVEWEGDYYYVADGANIVRSKNKYLTNTNDLTFPDGTPIPNAYYDFDADGKMIVPQGIVGNAYYHNGVMVPSYYGLVEWEGDYYYVADNAEIVRSKNKYLTTTNDLTFPDGTVIPHAYYDFDADGKMIVPQGIVGNAYYVNGVMVGSYYGLVEWEGDYYYIADNAEIVRNKNKYLTTTNGLTFPDGTVIPNAYYQFDEDGKMVVPQGIVGNAYYINGVMVPSYYGLVEWEGDYYYIADNAEIVKNKNKYLTTTNGLTFPNGDPIPNAYYQFDADGKMVVPQGIVGNAYYINGVQVGSYYGLVKWNGDFYYIADNAEIVRSKNKYLTTTNDLTFDDGTPVPHAYFEFDADGKMIIPES